VKTVEYKVLEMTASENLGTISLPAWQAGGGFFKYRRFDIDYKIFYRDSAEHLTEEHAKAESSQQDCSKPVLLLIHGFPTASIDWHAVWPVFNQHFRLITLDMMGFGLSDKPKDYQYSIHDQADIHQSLLIALGITDYHLMAHDYGDTVAQELLARQSEQENTPSSSAHRSRILSTLLLNGGLFPETHRPVLMQKLLASPVGALLIKFYSFSKFKKTFAHICAQPISEDELKIYWQLLQKNEGAVVMPKLIRYMQERREFRVRWVGALENNRSPMRLIDGIADPISGAHMVERYKQLVEQPDVVELEGIGHYPQVEAPQQVISAAIKFWQQYKII
jgi:pimeloyl-ACP methyl ester carboxylesterase